MSLIDRETVKAILDRVAYQYGTLVSLEEALSPNAEAASIEMAQDPDTGILYTSLVLGSFGNNISIQYRVPVDLGGSSENSRELTVEVERSPEGAGVVISLATNASGIVTSTANDVIELVNSDCECQQLVSASLMEGHDGTGVLGSSARSFLAGGVNGAYTDLVVGTQNADVVSQMTIAAGLLDQNISALKIFQTIPYWVGMLASLNNHFVKVGQVNLLAGYLVDNELRVHRDLDTVFNLAFNAHLPAASVFRPDQITLASSDLAYTSTPASNTAKFAARTIGTGNAGVTWVSKLEGDAGLDITITYVDGSLSNLPTEAVAVGTDITITLGTNSSPAVIGNAQDAVDAVLADGACNALVRGILLGDGTGQPEPVTGQALLYSDSDSLLTFTAVATGLDGKAIQVEFLNPGSASDLIVERDDYDPYIMVTLEHDGTDLVSTAADVKAAWEATKTVMDLATIALPVGHDGLGPVFEMPVKSLALPIVSNTDPGTALGLGAGATSNTNYAPQSLVMQVNPVNRGAYTKIYPVSENATLTVASGDAELTFMAVATGRAGQNVSIEFVQTGISTSLSCVVSGFAVVVRLATDSNGDVLNTSANSADNIKNAVDAAASALVTVVVDSLGSDIAQYSVDQAYLYAGIENTAFMVAANPTNAYVVTQGGGAGSNDFTLEFINPGVDNGGVASLTRSGASDYRVTLGRAGGVLTSTVNSIITLLSSDPTYGGQLVGSLLAGQDGTGVLPEIPVLVLSNGSGPLVDDDLTLTITGIRADLVQDTSTVTYTAGTISGAINPVLSGSNLIPTLTSSSNGTVTVTASNETVGFEAYRMYLASPTGFKATRPTEGSPAEIRVDFGVGNKEWVANYRLVSQGGASGQAMFPREWRFEGSDDGVNWFVLDTQSGVVVNTGTDPVDFNLTSPDSFRYFRLLVLADSGGSGGKWGLGDFELWSIEEFYSVSSITLNSGGFAGDSFVVQQVVEREITA